MAQADSEVKEFIIFILLKISGPLSPQRGSSDVEKASAEPEARGTDVSSTQKYMQVPEFCTGFFTDQIPFFRHKAIFWIPLVRSDSNITNNYSVPPYYRIASALDCSSTLLHGSSSACVYRALSPNR
jgi:hypothetical protein